MEAKARRQRAAPQLERSARPRRRRKTRSELFLRPSVVHPVPYDEFPTGLTYPEVLAMFWMDDSDSSKWKYKRRNTILGKWHQIKKEMYEEYLNRLDVLAGRRIAV
jgi:hypothetical protein